MKRLLFVLSALLGCFVAQAQWSNNQAEYMYAFPEGKAFYESDVAMTPEGNTWLFVNYPEDGCTKYALQLIDSVGNMVFGEEMLLVSDYATRSYNVYNTYLGTDSKGNAIVVVHDCRYRPDSQMLSYTAYKVSQEGEFLWGTEGVSLDGENANYFSAAITIAEIADGSMVFAWQEGDTITNQTNIRMQRVSADGELLWNIADVEIADEKISYSYPYVVDGGNNQVLLVYAAGTNQDLYVRKIDFDGTPVWSEDTRIYRSGWGSIPIWSILDIEPAGDGGVIVSWNDDRNYTNIESAYMTYVKPNGEIGFTADIDAQKLSYSGLRALGVKCKYDPYSDSFIALWRECNSSQTWYRMVAQKLNKDGELLWGETGLEIRPLEQTTYAYHSLQIGAKDEVAFFYMQNHAGNYAGDVGSVVTVVNVNDTTIRRENEFTKCDTPTQKQAMETTAMYDGKYWTVKWEEGSVSNPILAMQRVNSDLTVGGKGDAGVERVKTANNTFVALASVVENDAMFATNMAQATSATLHIYNVNGSLVATPFDGVLAAGKQYIEWNANVPAGIYLATLTTPHSVATVKLLVK